MRVRLVRRGVLALAVVVVAMVALLFVASPRQSRVLDVEPDVQALVVGKPWGFPGGPQTAALYSGELVVLEGGCLGFNQGSRQSAVVFPTGTRALLGGGGVRTPEGRAVRIGDQIEAGGGSRDLGPGENWVVELWPATADTCGRADDAQSLHDITVVEAS